MVVHDFQRSIPMALVFFRFHNRRVGIRGLRSTRDFIRIEKREEKVHMYSALHLRIVGVVEEYLET